MHRQLDLRKGSKTTLSVSFLNCGRADKLGVVRPGKALL
jgi:hypothetical protein